MYALAFFILSVQQQQLYEDIEHWFLKRKYRNKVWPLLLSSIFHSNWGSVIHTYSLQPTHRQSLKFLPSWMLSCHWHQWYCTFLCLSGSAKHLFFGQFCLKGIVVALETRKVSVSFRTQPRFYSFLPVKATTAGISPHYLFVWYILYWTMVSMRRDKNHTENIMLAGLFVCVAHIKQCRTRTGLYLDSVSPCLGIGLVSGLIHSGLDHDLVSVFVVLSTTPINTIEN